jgi:hypothetical protein
MKRGPPAALCILAVAGCTQQQRFTPDVHMVYGGQGYANRGQCQRLVHVHRSLR